MIIKKMDGTGDQQVDTIVDGREVAREFFEKALQDGYWGVFQTPVKDTLVPTFDMIDEVAAEQELTEEQLQQSQVVLSTRMVGG